MKKVACVGIIVADVIVKSVDDYPKRGELKRVDSITLHNGGNAMTAAVNLKKLGIDTYMVGKIGNDFFGKYLTECFNEYEIDTRGLKIDRNVQTSASVALIDEKTGERSFLHCAGSDAVFCIDDIDFDIIEESDIVFLTGSFLLDTFDGMQTAEFLKRCKKMGKTTFLDVCWDAKGNWGKLLNMSMPYIDWFMPSIDEAVKISGETDTDRISEVFFERGIKNVVIKMGSDGCFLRQRNDLRGKKFPVVGGITPIDTTGAGDSFCSGFLAAYAREQSPQECIRFANAAGAACVSAIGATTGIKSYEQIEKIMEDDKNAGYIK